MPEAGRLGDTEIASAPVPNTVAGVPGVIQWKQWRCPTCSAFYPLAHRVKGNVSQDSTAQMGHR